MDIEQIDVDALTPYAGNARMHTEEQVDQIARSLKEFGFINPILADAQNVIIAGHGRLLAAMKLGLKRVPVVRVEHLTDAQRKAYTIADNRLALDAAWDWAMLAKEMETLTHEGVDLMLLGFSDGEMELLERLGSGEAEGVTENVNVGDDRFLLQVEFDSEDQLQVEFEAMQSRGFKCKVLT